MDVVAVRPVPVSPYSRNSVSSSASRLASRAEMAEVVVARAHAPRSAWPSSRRGRSDGRCRPRHRRPRCCSRRKICSNVCLTELVPAPEEPVIEMIGCLTDMGALPGPYEQGELDGLRRAGRPRGLRRLVARRAGKGKAPAPGGDAGRRDGAGRRPRRCGDGLTQRMSDASARRSSKQRASDMWRKPIPIINNGSGRNIRRKRCYGETIRTLIRQPSPILAIDWELLRSSSRRRG